MPTAALETRRYLIYGLVDPRSLLIRYVGQSARGLARPKRHYCKSPQDQTWCANWVRELQRNDLKFEICVLEAVETRTALNEVERWWIAYGRASGWPLTNTADGGTDIGSRKGRVVSDKARARISSSWTPERRTALRKRNRARTGEHRSDAFKEEQRQRQQGKKQPSQVRAKIGHSKLGKRHSAERRQQNSNAQRGKILSEETKRKISEAMKLHFNDPVVREKQRNTHLGHKHSADTKAKISAANYLRHRKET